MNLPTFSVLQTLPPAPRSDFPDRVHAQKEAEDGGREDGEMLGGSSVWSEAVKTDARPPWKRGDFSAITQTLHPPAHKRPPNSDSNSSESFHSIGEQLALTELTPCPPRPPLPSHNPLFSSCQSPSPPIHPAHGAPMETFAESTSFPPSLPSTSLPPTGLSTRLPRQPV